MLTHQQGVNTGDLSCQ